jgi:predicted ATPase
MKIQRVKIKEFKKLKDIDLKIDGQNIWIKGENGMGKSTLMQFIEAALGWHELNTILKQSLKTGQVLILK